MKQNLRREKVHQGGNKKTVSKNEVLETAILRKDYAKKN